MRLNFCFFHRYKMSDKHNAHTFQPASQGEVFTTDMLH